MSMSVEVDAHCHFMIHESRTWSHRRRPRMKTQPATAALPLGGEIRSPNQHRSLIIHPAIFVATHSIRNGDITYFPRLFRHFRDETSRAATRRKTAALRRRPLPFQSFLSMRGADSAAAAAAIIFVVSFVVRSEPFFRTKTAQPAFVRPSAATAASADAAAADVASSGSSRSQRSSLARSLARSFVHRRRRRRITFFGTFVFMRTGGRERRLTAAARPARPRPPTPPPPNKKEREKTTTTPGQKGLGERREARAGMRPTWRGNTGITMAIHGRQVIGTCS